MHLVTLVNAVSRIVVLVRCALAVSMLMDAVIEVMLVNASRVAVRDCCTRLLYSGGSVGECCESHCSTRSLYSGSQYAGGRCTLEVAWVNAVGRIAVLIHCTLAVSTLEDAVLWRSRW